MRRWRPLLMLLLLSLASRSEAITIALSPSDLSTPVGGPFTLELVVSGLADGEDLGSWEVDVSFDETLFSLDGVSFGSVLGGPDDSVQDALSIGAGTWNLAEISLLSPTELEGQPASFVLATLTFSALAEGAGIVVLANGDAGDALANPFATLALESAQIVVVPEPGTALLLASALLAVAHWRSARHSRRA